MEQESRHHSEDVFYSHASNHIYNFLKRRSLFNVVLAVSVVVSLSSFIGCDNSSSKKNTPKTIKARTIQGSSDSSQKIAVSIAKTEAFQPFYIFSSKGSRQNHYVPSGFMPNGNCITFSDVWRENCQSGKTCMKVDYDVECSRKDQKWIGIYWLNPANNWGTRKGGFNLTGARKLTFWARGENGGEQIQEFTIGGISGDYPDTDTAVIGPTNIIKPQLISCELIAKSILHQLI